MLPVYYILHTAPTMLKRLFFCLLAGAAIGQSDPLSCDLSSYKEQPGLKAQVSGDALQLAWSGEQNEELRALFAIDRGVPTIRELAARKQGGQWKILGHGLTPEYSFVSGKRRIGTDQLAPLRQLGITNPKDLDARKWMVFWDAPLMLPGIGGRNEDLPRKPEEIHRGAASYHATGCAVNWTGTLTFNAPTPPATTGGAVPARLGGGQ